MRKSILFVINSLGCGGAEKSLLSLLSLLDYDKYDVIETDGDRVVIGIGKTVTAAVNAANLKKA